MHQGYTKKGGSDEKVKRDREGEYQDERMLGSRLMFSGDECSFKGWEKKRSQDNNHKKRGLWSKKVK